jgi:hypothetical protein
MILTRESGAQEDQFAEKNAGKKSRDTIPLREKHSQNVLCVNLITSSVLFKFSKISYLRNYIRPPVVKISVSLF